MTSADSRIDRLLDAIDLVKENRLDEAHNLLRVLVHEDNDFEAAWMWLSLTVDSLDQSSLCLDNVLRVNPDNAQAARALYRIRMPEIAMQKQHLRLRFFRDLSLTSMWILALALLYQMLILYMS